MCTHVVSGTLLAEIDAEVHAMGFVKTSISAVALLCLMLVPAYAGQHGNSGNHGPSTHATQHQTATTHGPSSTSHGPSTTTHGSSKSSGAPATKGSSAKAASTTTSTTSPKSKK